MSSTAASSPLVSPVSSAPGSPRAGAVAYEAVHLPAVISPSLACLIGQMFTKWSFVKMVAGFHSLKSYSPPAQARPKAPRAPRTPKSPKTPVEIHPCQACSWHDPKGDFTPVDEATQGKIPLDRKMCGKNGTVQVDDGQGGKIWVCAVHARPCADTCSRCQKNKHIDFDGGHGKAYLQTGFFCGDCYVEGTCEALIREGASKLAKLGYTSRMAQID